MKGSSNNIMGKRFSLTIDTKGNVKFKTIEGFAGNNCSSLAETVMAVANGTAVSSGDTDERYKEAENDISTFLG